MATHESGSARSFALHIFQLLLGHAEIMTKFVYKRLADLIADFSLIGADRFNVLLIENDVGRNHRKIKNASLSCGHAVENAEKKPSLFSRLGRFLFGRKILDKNRDVLDTVAEFLRQRIQRFLCNLDELFALHPSTAEERGHAHTSSQTNRCGVCRAILGVSCSCPMVRLAPLRIGSEPMPRAEKRMSCRP